FVLRSSLRRLLGTYLLGISVSGVLSRLLSNSRIGIFDTGVCLWSSRPRGAREKAEYSLRVAFVSVAALSVQRVCVLLLLEGFLHRLFAGVSTALSDRPFRLGDEIDSFL